MFEDSFVSSRVAGAGAGRTRWLLVGSLVVQGCVAAMVIALPMLRPERLVARVSAPVVFVPMKPVMPPKVVTREVVRSASAAAVMPEMTRVVNAPGRIPHGIAREDPGAAPEVASLGALTGAMDRSGLPGVVGGERFPSLGQCGGSAASEEGDGFGWGDGGVVAKADPAGVPGDREGGAFGRRGGDGVDDLAGGTDEGLQVVRGPEMLRVAAVDAVRQARYRPFLLNGEPTKVQTTITVVFQMGG